MPDRRYLPLHRPPTVGDRFAAHHTVVILAVWWAVMGVLVAVTALFDPPATFTFALVADEVGLPLGLALTVAGVGLVWSILTRTLRVSLVWDVQQSAYILAFFVWKIYTIAVFLIDPWSLVSLGHGLVMTVISAVGFIVSKLSERAGRGDIRTAGGTA